MVTPNETEYYRRKINGTPNVLSGSRQSLREPTSGHNSDGRYWKPLVEFGETRMSRPSEIVTSSAQLPINKEKLDSSNLELHLKNLATLVDTGNRKQASHLTELLILKIVNEASVNESLELVAVVARRLSESNLPLEKALLRRIIQRFLDKKYFYPHQENVIIKDLELKALIMNLLGMNVSARSFGLMDDHVTPDLEEQPLQRVDLRSKSLQLSDTRIQKRRYPERFFLLVKALSEYQAEFTKLPTWQKAIFLKVILKRLQEDDLKTAWQVSKKGYYPGLEDDQFDKPSKEMAEAITVPGPDITLPTDLFNQEAELTDHSKFNSDNHKTQPLTTWEEGKTSKDLNEIVTKQLDWICALVSQPSSEKIDQTALERAKKILIFEIAHHNDVDEIVAVWRRLSQQIKAAGDTPIVTHLKDVLVHSTRQFNQLSTRGSYVFHPAKIKAIHEALGAKYQNIFPDKSLVFNAGKVRTEKEEKELDERGLPAPAREWLEFLREKVAE